MVCAVAGVEMQCGFDDAARSKQQVTAVRPVV
jgi:hypothetical protein